MISLLKVGLDVLVLDKIVIIHLISSVLFGWCFLGSSLARQEEEIRKMTTPLKNDEVHVSLVAS